MHCAFSRLFIITGFDSSYTDQPPHMCLRHLCQCFMRPTSQSRSQKGPPNDPPASRPCSMQTPQKAHAEQVKGTNEAPSHLALVHASSEEPSTHLPSLGPQPEVPQQAASLIANVSPTKLGHDPPVHKRLIQQTDEPQPHSDGPSVASPLPHPMSTRPLPPWHLRKRCGGC